uniref:Uncharacterized protein n=1 Tax=Quercus lobata TaxID=97700 RepID=A0A7N2N6Y3_QUELO
MTKKVRIFCSSSNRLTFSPKMGHEMKAIRERLNAIAKDKEDFHFSPSFVEPQVMNRERGAYSFVFEEVVGRENDKEVIIERLFNDNVVENITIIPIVGIGGLGKTTLAQLVYNDENVDKNFELKLWICISDIFDVKRIVKECLEQLTKRKHEGSFEILEKQFREGFNGKKYLLVLDNLWIEDKKKWLLLRNLLMDVIKDELGNIVFCKMHDLMHDLANLVAGAESTMLTLSEENIDEKLCHVSFDLRYSLRQFPIPMVKGMKIRTILGASVGQELGKLTCDALISNLNYLCTLDLSKLKLCVVPNSIGELKHLRYLDLSKNEDIEFLPNSITKLLNLQTLKLKYCKSLRELPRKIKNFVNLRHLDIFECQRLTHMPLGIELCTSLEILPLFVVSKAKCSGGLSELKELSNLGGSLSINNLGNGKDDMLELECKAAILKEKQQLQQLKLWWDSRWAENNVCYDEMSLEKLQPHPNLKALKLGFYMGVIIPSWVSSLTSIVHLEFYRNIKLQHLPPLCQLPFLKIVILKYMEALEYISKDILRKAIGSSKTTFFPSLSSLIMYECPNLKGWWRKFDGNELDHLLLPSFPCLSLLKITECANLTSMPLFPYLKEGLILDTTSLKAFHHTMIMGETESPSTAGTTSTSSSLEEINNLESLPEEKCVRNLISLKKLSIYDCNGLKSLPCKGWIGHLTSLQSLEIDKCHELTSLPRGIRNLSALQEIIITNCPLLQQRCQRQTGEDWPNIAHVRYVYVDNKATQNFLRLLMLKPDYRNFLFSNG